MGAIQLWWDIRVIRKWIISHTEETIMSKYTIDDILGEGFADSMTKTIEEVRGDKPKVAVNIELFKEMFIDFFTGEKQDDNFIQKWVSWVGGPDVPVNIVHEDELIYTIEPVIKSLPYRDYDREQYEPAHILKQCQALLSVNPTKSRNKMVDAVRHWIKLHDTEKIYFDSIRWNKVLELCGKEQIDLTAIKYVVYLQKKAAGENVDDQHWSDVSGMTADDLEQEDNGLDYGEF